MSVTFPGGMTYTPGVRQRLTVTVTDTQARAYGFQLTARLASNETNAQAGDFNPIDGFTQVLCDSGSVKGPSGCGTTPVQFVEHTSAGSTNTFSFDWTPPASNLGNVRVYVAANGSTGNPAPPRGAHIYTTNYTLTPTSGSNRPTISQNGVSNGASFQPGITQGSWVMIKGANLASNTRTWRSDDIISGQLPTSLDGVSATIDGKPAYIYYISPTQINALAPADNNLGPVSVQVTNSGGTSDAATTQLQSFSPAFFQWDKYAVATRLDYSLVGKPNLLPGATFTPAKPGDMLILWGTGFGPTNPLAPVGKQVDNGRIYSIPQSPPVTVLIGGVQADYLAGALTPGAAGLYQIVVKVPATVADGDIPITVQVGGFQSPNNVFITVQR